ncbi:hypothetical protein Tco_0180745 [Tanacetum coccineum]
MSTLKFADTHNMVAFLSKPTESDRFEQIVDGGSRSLKGKIESLGEDAFKHGRIDAIDADEEITLVSVHDVLDGEKVFVPDKEVNDEVNVVKEVLDDITLAQALEEMKSTKPKKKGDKGKGILIEPVKPMKKKDLIKLNEETALNLQAEFDEEERLAREKAGKEEEVNIALIKTWDDI